MSIAARPKKQENVAVGARLARLRVVYGWTQSYLALLIGWVDATGAGNRARIAQLETGRVAFSNIDQREAVAKAFGLSLGVLSTVLRGDMSEEHAHRLGVRELAKRLKKALK